MDKLKDIIQDLDCCKVEDMTSLKQAVTPREILRVLKNNKVFTPSDVICMQYILKRTDCPELFTKCIEYAEQQNALCFYEKPLENDFQRAGFHVRGNLSDYSKEQIERIKETVASIVECTPEEIHENGYLKSSSFLVVLSMRELFARKLLTMKHDEKDSLRRLNIDYIKLNNDTVNLEISKVGQDPPCSISKVSVGTQTMLETPQGLDPSGFWTRGTYEHTVLQKSVNSVVTKYSLTGKKDSNWEAATTEVMTSFSCDMPQTPTIRQKIQARMKKSIYWMRFYTKKEKEAQKSGISVRSFLSRKRKINKSKDGEPAGLLEEEHETGADNRDDAEAVPPHHEDTDSDSSDSDTPLALYAQKMKKI